MKYVVSVMIVILCISVPLSYVGFSVAPTFTSTLTNIGNSLDRSDNFFVKIMGDLIAKYGFDTTNLTGNIYVFDPESDQRIQERFECFSDVCYLIRFKPNVKAGQGIFYGIFMTDTGKAINDVFDKANKPAGFKEPIGVNDIPVTYLAFNAEGEFIRAIFPFKNRHESNLFIYVDSPSCLSNSFYSDFISSCAVEVSYKTDPLIGKSKTNTYNYQVSTKYKGNFKDFYNYYLIGGGSF